jgi:ferredoxin
VWSSAPPTAFTRASRCCTSGGFKQIIGPVGPVGDHVTLADKLETDVQRTNYFPETAIHPDECMDCEACVPECPVEAIYHEDNVPEAWKDFVALNREMAAICPLITDRKEPLASRGAPS